MKKILIYILVGVVIVICFFLSKYYEFKQNNQAINEFNIEYLKYKDKEIYGIDIGNVVNKAVNDNENNLIEKDENGKYMQDDIKSINIEVKINDEEKDKIYTMETLYGGGMIQFVKYYGQILFKCSKVEYNSQGRVKYMLFEQIEQ